MREEEEDVGKQGNSAIIVKVGIQFSFYIFIPYEVSI